MKKICKAIRDGLIPNFKAGVSIDDFGKRQIDYTRISITALTWFSALALWSGKIKATDFLSLLQLLLGMK